MGIVSSLRLLIAAAAVAAPPWLAHAQGFTADYELAPALALGGDASGAGLSLRAGPHWFGQVDLAPGPASVNLAGGYRWAGGQSLSLQLSRGPSQRLGLAVNFDWPRYFVRFSYEPPVNLVPQERLRFSAGIRF